MLYRLPLPAFCILLAAGCASTTPEVRRQQMVVPSTVSQVYSEVDMQLQLATAASQTEDMAEDQCLLFDYQRQVRKVSERLVVTAQRLYPDLLERDVDFRFDVAPSADTGVLSNAGGNIVVLQGSRSTLPDAILAFVVAREIGHVAARHHDENSAATVMFSVLGQILFPAAALVKGLSTVLPTSVAGAAATASAVSYLGATALKSSYRDEQLREAERIAFLLLAESGWDLFDIAEAAHALKIEKVDATWLKELQSSLQQLDLVAFGPRRRHFRPGPYNSGLQPPINFAAIPASGTGHD